MTRKPIAKKPRKRPSIKLVLDLDTGHVLPATLERDTLTKLFSAKKYVDDEEARHRRLSELALQVSIFLRGARLAAIVDKTRIVRKTSFLFATYDGADRWGATFFNCVLIAETPETRQAAAEALGMKPVRGLTEWLFESQTGLIDAYATETIASLLARPEVVALRVGER
jgi:hypothetical protein